MKFAIDDEIFDTNNIYSIGKVIVDTRTYADLCFSIKFYGGICKDVHVPTHVYYDYTSNYIEYYDIKGFPNAVMSTIHRKNKKSDKPDLPTVIKFLEQTASYRNANAKIKHIRDRILYYWNDEKDFNIPKFSTWLPATN